MNKSTTWRLDYLQILAVILTVGMSWGLSSVNPSGVKAESVAGDQTGPVLQVELPATQPSQIVQLEDQWIARFKLSTESVDPIIVNGLVFWLQGSLPAEVIRYPGLFPLTLSSIDDEGIFGKGETWSHTGDYILQEVLFDQPIKISLAKPIQIDVHLDLQNRYQATVKIWLGEVLGPTSVRGLPLESKMLEVKERL